MRRESKGRVLQLQDMFKGRGRLLSFYQLAYAAINWQLTEKYQPHQKCGARIMMSLNTCTLIFLGADTLMLFDLQKERDLYVVISVIERTTMQRLLTWRISLR